MREILFRGKRLKDGKWVEGDLIHFIHEKFKHSIILTISDKSKVIEGEFSIAFMPKEVNLIAPETVGQFTGLTDKNGVKIFEGDIVSSKFWNPKNYKVIFQDGEFCFTTDNLQPYTNSIHYLKDFQVIGNIHDNPELL